MHLGEETDSSSWSVPPLEQVAAGLGGAGSPLCKVFVLSQHGQPGLVQAQWVPFSLRSQWRSRN